MRSCCPLAVGQQATERRRRTGTRRDRPPWTRRRPAQRDDEECFGRRPFAAQRTEAGDESEQTRDQRRATWRLVRMAEQRDRLEERSCSGGTQLAGDDDDQAEVADRVEVTPIRFRNPSPASSVARIHRAVPSRRSGLPGSVPAIGLGMRRACPSTRCRPVHARSLARRRPRAAGRPSRSPGPDRCRRTPPAAASRTPSSSSGFDLVVPLPIGCGGRLGQAEEPVDLCHRRLGVVFEIRREQHEHLVDREVTSPIASSCSA